MYSRDKLYIRSFECYFGAHLVTHKTILWWGHQQFATQVHTLFYMYWYLRCLSLSHYIYTIYMSVVLCHVHPIYAINTLRPSLNNRHFAGDTFKSIFVNGNVKMSFKILLKFVPKGPIWVVSQLWRSSCQSCLPYRRDLSYNTTDKTALLRNTDCSKFV